MPLVQDMFPKEFKELIETRQKINDIAFDSVPAPPAMPVMPNRFDPRRPNTTRLHPWWQTYLRSHAWYLKRTLVWDMRRGKCSCKENRWIEPQDRRCHHVTYERVGFEETDDLLALCKDCHDRIHEKDKKPSD